MRKDLENHIVWSKLTDIEAGPSFRFACIELIRKLLHLARIRTRHGIQGLCADSLHLPHMAPSIAASTQLWFQIVKSPYHLS